MACYPTLSLLALSMPQSFRSIELRFSLMGEGMILVSFGDERNHPVIDPLINAAVMALSEVLEEHSFTGFRECIPAYNSLGVVFDPLELQHFMQDGSPYHFAREFIANRWSEIASNGAHRISGERKIRIPVCYNGPDLESLAAAKGITAEEVIAIHCSNTYAVYMMGFLPGFAYMGTVDDRIAMPRHASPRKVVSAGSVGIAGQQTGIYPLDSPGGWQLIGHTSVKLFDPAAESPFFLMPGDQVEFFSVENLENSTSHVG